MIPRAAPGVVGFGRTRTLCGPRDRRRDGKGTVEGERRMVNARILLLVLGATLVGSTTGWAKCATVQIMVGGTVEGDDVDGATVRVELYPSPRKDVVNQRALVSPDHDGKFAARVPFLTLNGRGLFGTGLFAHDCSRRPQMVVVSLIEGGSVVATQRVIVASSDLELDSAGNYRLKQPVMLKR